MGEPVDSQQGLQEQQYSFPYHYIPSWDGERFSPVRYWAWSHHYFGGFAVVLDLLSGLAFESLLDIGCGDGRFLVAAQGRYPEVEMLGVDYSSRAIDLARALNPNGAYEVRDIVSQRFSRRFDVATMIEVLEHIPPDQVPRFLRSVANAIVPGGVLVITVPHVNKPLQAKHYQHFSSHRIRELLARDFETIEIVPFDRRSRLLTFLHRLLGGRGRHVVVTDRRVQSAFWKLYRTHYLHTTEGACLRIAAICRRPLR